MVILMAAMALLALFAGTLAFVPGPVGLGLAVFVGGWLLLYAARVARSHGGRQAGLGRKAAHRG